MLATTRVLDLMPTRSPRGIFDAVVAHVRRYYDADEATLALIGLFVMSTYVFREFDAIPYLQIVGEPATGKTRLGEILELLAFEARLVARMSVPAVYRFIEELEGTLIIDEQQVDRPEMRDILNAGYKKSGAVMIVGPKGNLIELKCFGPKVLIANDPVLTDSLESRLITIVSRASKRPLARFRLGTVEAEFGPLVESLLAFGVDHRGEVALRYAELPQMDTLSDREFDIAAPLLSLAEVIDSAAGDPVRPVIERFLVDAAKTRKAKRKTESESAVVARLVVEFASNPRHDARRNPPSGKGMFMADELWRYVNRSQLLERPIRSTKVLAEKLNMLGLIEDRRVVDVDPDCRPDMPGRLRSIPNVKPPRTQRVVYLFDLSRARELAGEASHV